MLQVGACIPAGRIRTQDFIDLADVADKYSGGEVRITCEENVIFPNVRNEDIEAMEKEPIFQKFEIHAGSVMRGLVSCTGSEFCGFGLVETKNRWVPLQPYALVSGQVIMQRPPFPLRLLRLSMRTHVTSCCRAHLSVDHCALRVFPLPIYHFGSA